MQAPRRMGAQGGTAHGGPGPERQGGEGARAASPRAPSHGGPRPQGSLLSRQLPPFLDGFFRSSEPVVVRLMGTVSDTLHRLGAHGLGAQSLSIAINSRSFFEDVSVPRAGVGHPPRRQGGPAGRGVEAGGAAWVCPPPPSGWSSTRAQRPAHWVLAFPPGPRAHRACFSLSGKPGGKSCPQLHTWHLGCRCERAVS